MGRRGVWCGDEGGIGGSREKGQGGGASGALGTGVSGGEGETFEEFGGALCYCMY